VCRLVVEYRGTRAGAWRVESREYGGWTPHRRIARRSIPFCLRRRIVYRQNRHEFIAVRLHRFEHDRAPAAARSRPNVALSN
jgi:hypothetical protein